VDKVENGNRLVDQAGRTMTEVVGSIKRVAKIVTDIAEASREQSSGIEQVTLAVSQMDEVTQQNAALVEEAAAAAESLEEQAQVLSGAVAVFKVSDKAPAGGVAAERRGPDRAANVARIPAKSSPRGKPDAPGAVPRKRSKVVGGEVAEGEWEDF
jgi:methyl-accepting chemotaxis protein